jgi:hypothetical protein
MLNTAFGLFSDPQSTNPAAAGFVFCLSGFVLFVLFA